LVYVDYLKGAMEEAGDLLIPIEEGRFGPERITGELGELILGAKEGRTSKFQITVMKSVGFGALDVLCAQRAFNRALSEGLGVEVSL
jgi:ornithine cyclodeaminase